MPDSAHHKEPPRLTDSAAVIRVIADALAADHKDCPHESCCWQMGPDQVEARKVLTALENAHWEVRYVGPG